MHPQPAPPRSGRSRRTRTLALLAVPMVATPLLMGVASSDVATSAAAIPDDSNFVEPTNAPPAQAPLELDEPATVTLITGDKVTMHPGGIIETEPGPGREHIAFDEQNLGDQISVVPSDAAQLLTEGKLDERLFDITYLVREGYDDAHRDDMPLIVEGESEPVRKVASGPGTKVERESRQLKMSTVAQEKKGDKGRLWARVTGKNDAPVSLPVGVEKVWLDGMSHVTLDESVPQIGAPEVWESGYTGEGVTVAVLDTGVDGTHPDLAGQVVADEVFADNPNSGAFAVEQLDDWMPYLGLIGALVVPKQGLSDPLAYVGRACIDSEGDELLADPAGKTALIVRDQSACPLAEKYDAVVEAGATGVVIYNDEGGLFTGAIFGAERLNAVWGATISHADGTALVDLFDAGEDVTLTFTDRYAGDLYGHGTHVAATVAGKGVASDGLRKGVAPGAEVMNGKVCNDSGSCQNSWVIAGMEWAAENGADVVNLSLAGQPTDGTDPLSQAVNTLTEAHDVLFVVAAGNSGGAGVGTPGAADAALTVGAVNKNGELASFSSLGPRLGDLAVKPNVTAPGVGIVAARAFGTSLGEPVGDYYTSSNGTSMATPHVAGAAALLAQARPDLDAPAIKDALASTSVDGGYLWFEQGAGRVDVMRAVAQGVYANASVDFGYLAAQDGPMERQVTYTNHTNHVVVLQLRASLTDLLGRAAGTLELSRTKLAISPGREASVTVTVDPHALNIGAGFYGGMIIATGTDVSVRTAVGFGVQRNFVPLGDDWDEDWEASYTFAESAPIMNLNGATLGPDGQQLFLVGPTRGGDDSQLIVASVDASTGEEIWVADQPVAYASWGPAPGVAVAPDGSAIFVTQNVFDPERTQVDIVTVAYNNTPPQQPGDPQLGEQLWQSSHDAISPFQDTQPGGVVRIAVAPDGETVIVVGTQVEPLEGDQCNPPLASCTTSILTIAYDTRSGDQTWVSRHRSETDGFAVGGDVAISPIGDLAYVTGFEQQERGIVDVSPVTIAYVLNGDSRGNKRWMTRHESTTGNYQSWHNSVSDDGKLVFVSSTVEGNDNPFDERMGTQAYDAATGELLWSSQFGAADHGYAPGHTGADRQHKGGIAVSPNNDLVFVTGRHCEGGSCTGAYALVTVAYDQTTGEEQWFQIHESTGIPNRSSTHSPAGITAAASPDGSRLYVAGGCCWPTEGPENNDQVTLAYEAVTGELLGVARHKYTEDGQNQGLQVLVNPDGDTIYTVAEARPIGRPDFWGVAAYSPPIALSADPRRSRGNWYVDLTWSAPVAQEMDVYRDDELIATVEDTGTYTDELGKPKRGSTFEYKVCVAGIETCSKGATVEIGAKSRGQGPMEPN